MRTATLAKIVSLCSAALPQQMTMIMWSQGLGAQAYSLRYRPVEDQETWDAQYDRHIHEFLKGPKSDQHLYSSALLRLSNKNPVAFESRIVSKAKELLKKIPMSLTLTDFDTYDYSEKVELYRAIEAQKRLNSLLLDMARKKAADLWEDLDIAPICRIDLVIGDFLRGSQRSEPLKKLQKLSKQNPKTFLFIVAQYHKVVLERETRKYINEYKEEHRWTSLLLDMAVEKKFFWAAPSRGPQLISQIRVAGEVLKRDSKSGRFVRDS
jgi:hypothetical protein